MHTVELGFSFLAGLAMIASPCVLMLLPMLLGVTMEQRSRPLFIILGFVTAFTVVALLFAKGASFIGVSPIWIRQVSIILLAVFALAMLWPHLYERISKALNVVSDLGLKLSPQPGAGKAGGFVMGLSLGAVWTPCSGPVLASIIALVASTANLAWGLSLLLVFGLGAAIPMLIIAYGGKSISVKLPLFARNSDKLRKTFGVLMLILVAYMQWQQLTDAAGWVANKYQGWL